MKTKLFPVILLICILVSSCQEKPKTPESVSTENKTNRQALTKEKQGNLTIDEIIQQFKDGNERFLNNKTSHEEILQQVKQTGTEGQFPKAIVLGCIDSRSPIEVIFDKNIGDVFGTRVAGNYADPGIIGGIEFACKVMGAKLIIVLGHTDCGAIKGACDNVKLGNITVVMDELRPAVDSVKGFADDRSSKSKEFVNAVTEKNVRLTMKKISDDSEILSGLEKEGKVKIIGAVYNVKTGKVDFLN